MKIFRPWVFQGTLRRKNYFEGWYFKHVSADRKSVYAIIPGISLSGQGSHSFIQLLNGITGESYYYKYHVNSFRASSRVLSLKVADSSFSSEGINLNVGNGQETVSGGINYHPFNHYPSSPARPGIMGWYSFVPFMECKHGVVSTGHDLDGSLKINNSIVDFSGGRGYIEKDWGTSFPESWIWLHCNTFKSSDASFTFSVAKIPWLGSYFIGFISYLRYGNKFYNFSTWSGAKVKSLEYNNDILDILIENRKHTFKIRAVNKMPGKLKAPVKGSMNRVIKETVDADIEIILSDKAGNTLFRDHGARAGMELIDSMPGYFQDND